MKQWHVTYYYLATGMEGRADTRDYGVVSAETADEAMNKVIEREFPSTSPQNKEWMKGCLSAERVS